MSDAADKESGEKKKRCTRGKRGGGKNNTNKEERSLQDKVIELLRSEGFNITPPAKKQTAKEPKENVKPSTDKEYPDISTQILQAILDVHDAEENKNFKPKKKVQNSTSSNIYKISKKSSKSLKGKQEQSQRRNETQKPVRNKKKKKNKKTLDIDDQYEDSMETLERVLNKKKKEMLKSADTNSEFRKYIEKKDALEILANQDPENPTHVKGHIRINPKQFNHAYLNIDEEVDILIVGIRDRNRAMERDLVLVMLNPKEDWRTLENGEIQKTGIVVRILEKIHPRKVVGTLILQGDSWKLKSRDLRVPTLMIDRKSVPAEVRSMPEAYEQTLFLANMDQWPKPFKCTGFIEKIMGEVGGLEEETMAILVTNGLDVTPYDDELTEGIPSSDYVLTADDIEAREDWRQECIFTIDPATAVDLDDAVSCKKLPNGNYEVGVHISDVTHYLEALSPLDQKVCERATTVYLVNAVYHMLPKSLCQLCSLLPGHDKLAFSVIWEMTPEAKVIKHRFTKSVINSCYQMAYEKAQAMIDESSREWTEIDLPGLESKFTANDLCETVNNLYKLSTQMREKRFSDGALSINQPKLQIVLDPETRVPVSYRIEERQDSNRLIEEFMLLANMTVAKHLYETMPDTALLRIHGEPLKRVLSRTADDLAYLGVHLNTESAGSLQSSLSLYEKTGLEGYDQEFVTNCRMMVINALCAQSMPRANYMCSASIKKEEGLRHFALNVPFYTHFTSPIRRYPDCVVHRLLFASITKSPLPTCWSSKLCSKIASNCNGKKYSAKIAQEKSNELYFMDLLSRKGPTKTMAIVMRVKQRSLDVILCHIGITIELNFSEFEKKAEITCNKEHSVATVIVKWKESDIIQTINVFSMINLSIEKHPKCYAIRGILLPPQLNNTRDV